MARKRGKMALYEVMSKRAEHSRNVEPLQPQKKPEPVESVPVVEQIDIPEPQEKVNWRKKPRIVQYNLGRIEFSIPYQLAITAGLGLVLLLVLAFRVGQFTAGGEKQPVSEQTGSTQDNAGSDLTDLATSESTSTADSGATETSTSLDAGNELILGDPDGKNVILIARHDVLSQLRPVERYFNDNKIPVQIYQVGDTYQLWTKAKFIRDPATPGTNGYQLLQDIIRIGAKYEAPQGYESFAPHKFSDAYGRRID